MEDMPISIIHIHEDGSVDCVKCGDTRLFVIDERERHDQVFECALKVDHDFVADLIGGSTGVEHYYTRHAVLTERVRGRLPKRPYLRLVE